jgi:excisionase family DNA binding protein
VNSLLNVKEAARAWAVSPWTIRAYIRDGKLRPVRIGRLVRLEAAELERFVNENAKKAESNHTVERGDSNEQRS